MCKSRTLLLSLIIGVGAVLSSASGSARAALITYTLQAPATGTFEGVNFTDALVTLMMMNDTNAIMDLGGGLFEINGTATVSVNGVAGGAPVAFADPMQVFVAQQAALGTGTVGFFDISAGLDVLDDTDAAFATYALGPIGPLTAGMATLGAPGFPFPLADGSTLTLTDVVGTATFTASLAVIPEPPIGRGMSFVLAIVGAGVLGAKLMRQWGTDHRL
jgi:hypothetical protein